MFMMTEKSEVRAESECHENHMMTTTRVFGLHLCRRQCGSSLTPGSLNDVVGSKTYCSGRIDTENGSRAVEGHSMSPISVPIKSSYAVASGHKISRRAWLGSSRIHI